MTSFLWDQHTCLPLQTDTSVEPLIRYHGHDMAVLVSVNAGYSPHSFRDTTALLDHYRAAISAHPDLELAAGVGDATTITRGGRIAVVFDLEDSRPSTTTSTTWRPWPTSGCARCCRPTTTPIVQAAVVWTPPMPA